MTPETLAEGWRGVHILGDATWRQPAGEARFSVEWKLGTGGAWLVIYGPRSVHNRESLSAREARELGRALLQVAEAVEGRREVKP